MDGARGELKLLAVDLANDLAVVRLEQAGAPFFQFNSRATGGGLPKGEHLYSMGNPLDLGFTIVEGTYNGLVERSYNERLHFTGAVNPGMSGGPAVAATVALSASTSPNRSAASSSASSCRRVSLSHCWRGRGRHSRYRRTSCARKSAARSARGRRTLRLAQRARLPLDRVGPYHVLESAAPWFTCWARTNADQVPKPRATVDSGNCHSDTRLFIASDLSTGFIQMSQSYLHSVDLNSFQFATFLSELWPRIAAGGWKQKWYTPQRCREDFIAVTQAQNRLPLRVLWCAHAYRAFDGLYDVVATATTQNSNSEALVVELSLQAVSYDNAVALTKQVLEGVQWTK